MKLRSYAYGAAMLASLALPVIATTSAHAAECQDLTWSKDQLSKLDAAIASEQQVASKQGRARQASDIDAAIASLEQDIGSRKGDAATKGQAVLNEIRAGRTKLDQLAANMMANAQAADPRQSHDEGSNALWTRVNAYLDAVGADISARQAANQTRFLGN